MAQITAISTALLEKNELTWQAPFLAPRGRGAAPVGLAAPPLTSWASPLPVTVLSRARAARSRGGACARQDSHGQRGCPRCQGWRGEAHRGRAATTWSQERSLPSEFVLLQQCGADRRDLRPRGRGLRGAAHVSYTH